MGDRPRDDTKQPAPAPRPTREPGAYYYDDRTNYELYDPSDDDDEDEDADRARDDEAPPGETV